VLAGRNLAEVGTSETPACFSCHGAEGQGNGSRYPRIGGQPEPFVITRLLAFQGRAKASAPQPGTMTAVAATLDAAQIREAAAYLASLEP
jgi:cytochrome c553